VEGETIHPLDVKSGYQPYDVVMTNVYLADAQPAERLALRLLLKDLKIRVVGEGSDWQTVIENAPGTNPDLILVDWGLVSDGSGNSLSSLRELFPPRVQIILISNFDTREQAALSTGADGFISKTEMIENVADLILEAASKIDSRKILEKSEQIHIPEDQEIRVE
jgi:DNA-binding NarL/FixJ family response regulator